MTPHDLIDGLTGSEVRQFALAVLQAMDRASWHRDCDRFVRDMQDCADLAERLALEPADYAPIPVETQIVRYIPIIRALTDEQRAAIRREYIPRKRGARHQHDTGPSLKQLADRYGVSYTAARNAVREAA